MKITDYIKENITYTDGGMGTLLQAAGLQAGEHPERWAVSHPDVITKLNRDYYNAGSNIVLTDTFGATCLNFDDDELELIIKSAIECTKKACETSTGTQEKFIAFDMGSMGKLLKPYGDFEFEDAVSVFKKSFSLAEKYGVDLIFIETMNDSYETKAAVIAAKESTNLPVFVSNAYSEDCKLMTGASPSAMVAMLEGLGADAIGINCSFGPKALMPVIEEYLRCASVPVIFEPNAGLPQVVNGKTVFNVNADDFSTDTALAVEKGVRIVGGCCGTTPEYIAKLVAKTKGLAPIEITDKKRTVVSSYTHTVEFGENPVLIGERINPTGKKRFKQALKENDIGYILNEGIRQQDKGAHVLDVNVGLPEIDEVKMLTDAVCELQTVTDLPLQIDTSDPIAMESALRRYNGKALINSVNGKQESMDAIFPLVKKYGGVVVALTLDENGIPETAQGRVEIAKRILCEAEKYGIAKKDIIFDTLAMTVSTDANAAKTTVDALREIKYNLGCHTSLGVSNISFGLPNRDLINGTFFALALNNGLSAAIMNPDSAEMMKTYYTYRALNGLDDNCTDYIEFASSYVTSATQTDAQQSSESFNSDLQKAIIKGLKTQSANITAELVKTNNPLEIVQSEIIPALNIVGEGFEKKKFYLPQLLMSAEAAGCAFEEIKKSVPAEKNGEKCAVVIATVKGDIHDIGKNIVKLLLENYGFKVIDLGKDVAPETIVDKVLEINAPVVGLSALMTTTVPAMEETISQLKEKAPWCKTVVGGAVLTQDYADKIGADKYAKDAMETVRYCEIIDKEC